ncbi:uncharacterized protein LOC129613308 [Condylostylus longicornis]|uniref:uncharacterized protein LOC129613308 n=1 Tax=Condylostylus longicornis TaxID=2530218 RepID=UPI00244E350A|nr:uncharacterized protein LOC129613308 [Condylostylus longicornis]
MDEDFSHNLILIAIDSFDVFRYNGERFLFNETSIKKTFPIKAMNMHQCKIRIFLANDPPYLFREIIKQISKALNFEIEPFILEDNVKSYVFANDTTTGAFKILQDGDIQIAIGRLHLGRSRSKYFSFSHSYYASSLVLIIQAGEKYSSIERLQFPFTLNTWLTLISMIIIGILIIIIIERRKIKIRNFVFGHKNQIPILNMLSSFLGGIVIPQPRFNFARSILIFWICTSFVLRNAYQAALYNFIRMDQMKTIPLTINEVLYKNYKIYASTSVQDMLVKVPYIKYYTNILNVSELETFQELLINDDDYEDDHDDDDNYIHIAILCPQKNSFLKRAIDYEVQKYMYMGFIKKWEELYVDLRSDYDRNSKLQKQKPLRIDQLIGIFQLYYHQLSSISSPTSSSIITLSLSF